MTWEDKAYGAYLAAWHPPTRDPNTGELRGTWEPMTRGEFKLAYDVLLQRLATYTKSKETKP